MRKVNLGTTMHDGSEQDEASGEQCESIPRAAWLGTGSLFAACIEALCALLLAISKLGILLAFTSFLSTVIISRFHDDRVRVPVLGLALFAALANLFVLRNWQRLRNAPAAAWRRRR